MTARLRPADWVDTTGLVEVWVDDCRDVLPDLSAASIDLVLTDPGYDIPAAAAAVRTHATAIETMADQPQNRPAPGWLPLAARLLRPGGYLVEFCNSHLEALEQTLRTHRAAGLEPWMPYAFVKTTVQPTPRPTFCHGFELAVISYRPPARSGWWGGGSTLNRWIGLSPASRRTGSGHPFEKPLQLTTSLVAALSPPGGRVLDPFAGSGSTLHAARNLNRSCLGIEIDPHWMAAIQRRLAQQHLPLVETGTQAQLSLEVTTREASGRVGRVSRVDRPTNGADRR